MITPTVSAPNLNQWVMDAKRWDSELDTIAMTRAFEKIKRMFYQHEGQVFSSRGSVTKSGIWPPLSAPYKKWKRKHYPGKPIMVLTGALRASLRGDEGAIATMGKLGAKSFYMKLGTHVTSEGDFDYPKYHQEKAKDLRKTIDPKDSEINSWLKPIQLEIVNHAKNRGRTFVDRYVGSIKASWDKR